MLVPILVLADDDDDDEDDEDDDTHPGYPIPSSHRTQEKHVVRPGSSLR